MSTSTLGSENDLKGMRRMAEKISTFLTRGFIYIHAAIYS